MVELRIDRLDVDEGEVRRLHSLLDSREQDRAARFRFPRHRRRFIVRRGRLREWLGSLTGTAARDVAYAEGAYGKPVIPGWGRHFSTSHSDELMLMAVSDSEVGCDIEKVKPDLDWRPLAERLFAPAERASLAAMDDAAGRAAFFRCWARKEAFVKAIGQGLSYPLEAFEVSLGEEASLLKGGEGWQMTAWDVPGHGCAIVAPDDGTPLTVSRLG